MEAQDKLASVDEGGSGLTLKGTIQTITPFIDEIECSEGQES